MNSAQQKMEPGWFERERRRKKLLRLLLSLLLLLLTIYLVWLYGRSRELPLPQMTGVKGKIPPPRYLFSIEGTSPNSLARPNGVAIHPRTGNIYVTDTGHARVEVFSPNGTFLFNFNKVAGGKTLALPVYVAINSKGQVYVSDRGWHDVFIFSTSGKFISRFKYKDKPSEWHPVALAFDEKDNLYMTEILEMHKLAVFNSKGKLKWWTGGTGQVEKVQRRILPGKFYFPNGVAVDKRGYIYVADSDNQRIQIFNQKGKLKKILITGGLPRGMSIGYKGRIHVVDVFAHNVMVITPKWKPLLVFGSLGVDYAQFNYPNDVKTDGRRIYVADRQNNRVQVWVWPIAEIAVPSQVRRVFPWLKYLPLLLLLLYLLLRRRKYVPDKSFLQVVVGEQKIPWLKDRFRRILAKLLLVTPATFEEFKFFEQEQVRLADLIKAKRPKKDLVQKIINDFKIAEEKAAVLALAKGRLFKAWVLTEDAETRKIALELELKALNYEEAMELFKEKKPGGGPSKPPSQETSECQAITSSGERCRNRARPGSKYCGVHQKREK